MNEKLTNDMNDMDELLTRTTEGIAPNSQFTVELERKLAEAHTTKLQPGWFHFTRRQVFTTLAWTVSLIAFALFMNWAISTVAPIPTEIPASNDTVVPLPTEKLVINNGPQGTPVPAPNSGYYWRDTKLYLSALLPDAPTEANIYLLKEDQQATIESARALAERFGLPGEAYHSNGLYPTEASYFFTDGKQSLTVGTDFYFTYVTDMSKVINNFKDPVNPDAETVINDFLQTHGFDFPHKVQKASLYTGYEVVPLTPEGIPMRYEFFSSRLMRVMLDDNGQVLQVEANLMNYEPTGSQPYSIISAQEAFDKLLDDSITTGKIESGLSSAISGITEWMREYPLNETINLYGYASSIPALDPSKPAFIQIEGFTVTGNTSGMNTLERNTFVEATGQFIDQNGITTFNVESWQPSPFMQDGIVGTLQRENGQVLFKTEQGEELIIQPDLPADLPLPFENVFVVGIREENNIYEWTLIDDRAVGGGGGGGGGGGQGFYKLNLSGTPVAFPPTPSANDSSYIVQEGDTVALIAQKFDLSVEDLAQANALSDANVIYTGQQLIIPDAGGQVPTQPSEIGKHLENQRGIVTVTIVRKQDGTSYNEYTFATTVDGQSYAVQLTGDSLQGLEQYHNRPVNIWATIESAGNFGLLSAHVERFEVPFNNLQFQILRGKQKNITIDNQPTTLFTTDDGVSYVQINLAGGLDNSIVGTESDEVLLESLAVPDETVGGYPALRIYGSAMAVSTKNGKPVEMTVTADQPYTMDEAQMPENYVPPALTIEKVELMYFVTNPHWQVDHLDGSPLYLQPVWHFYGHFENVGEFDLIMQALKQEYLLPELDAYIQGG